jgi:hypothetical protein
MIIKIAKWIGILLLLAVAVFVFTVAYVGGSLLPIREGSSLVDASLAIQMATLCAALGGIGKFITNSRGARNQMFGLSIKGLFFSSFCLVRIPVKLAMSTL